MKISDRNAATVGQRLNLNWRLTAYATVVAVAAVFILANAHLIYVAFESQPDCVPHLKASGGQASGLQYSAAKSAC